MYGPFCPSLILEQAFRMTVLPISTPAPAARETLYSYLARIAAVWKTDAASLAYDMGAPYKRLLEHDEAAFDAFAAWAKLEPETMAELLSWTGIRAGKVRMEFRGELYISRALRNPLVRGCPICLREDAAGVGSSASTSMVMRGHWQLREAVLCVKHKHPLVALWKAQAPGDRFNIGARLAEIEAQVLAGALDQPIRTPSAYDLWLDRRVAECIDDTWLRDISAFAVTTFCRLLGEAIQSSKFNVTDRRAAEPHSLGFDIAVQGKNSIREALDQIATQVTGRLVEPYKAFGNLFARLRHEYADEAEFDPFRDPLRECILDNWPIASGETLLGKLILKRRNHSLRSAALETGVGSTVLEAFLVEAGVITQDNSRPDNRRLFDANAHAQLLSEIATLVGPVEMRTAMGATKREFSNLVEEGFLVPRTRNAKIKKPWKVSDGLALVHELSKDAVFVAEDDQAWETLLFACRRNAFAIAELIQEIREKRLKVGKRNAVAGFHGIVVLKSEVDLKAASGQTIRNTILEELSATMSAAEFGKSIGLPDRGAFLALIEAGHVSASLITNPRTGRPQYRMAQEDVAAFHQQFVTLTTLSAETGQHRNTLRKIFASSRLAPVFPGARGVGAVYLRDDVAKLMGTRS